MKEKARLELSKPRVNGTVPPVKAQRRIEKDNRMTYDERIEAMARAIDPASCRLFETGGVNKGHYEQACEHARIQARAADAACLAALEKPTQEMLNAAEQDDHSYRRLWHAMWQHIPREQKRA